MPGFDPVSMGLQAGGAVIGGIAGYLGGQAQDREMQDRFRQRLATIARLRGENQSRAQLAASGMLQQAMQAAARRAIASGRPQDVESNTLPATRQAALAGNEAVRNAVAPFDQEELSATADYENRPIQPSGWDFLQSIGGEASRYGANRDRLSALQSASQMSGSSDWGGIGDSTYRPQNRNQYRNQSYQ